MLLVPPKRDRCKTEKNQVNNVSLWLDSPTSDLMNKNFFPQTDFVGIQGILETGDLGAAPNPQDLALAPITSQDLALAQMYQRDSSLCLQK